MGTQSKILLIFPILFFFLYSVALAQAGEVPSRDENMDMFLLVILCIFFSVMLGVAIAVTCAVMILLFILFVMLTVGALSASVAFGLYKRSSAAGFKSFLVILFGIVCSVIGGFGLWLLNGFVDLKISGTILLFTGFVAGLAGGILMGLTTYKLIRMLVRNISRPFITHTAV